MLQPSTVNLLTCLVDILSMSKTELTSSLISSLLPRKSLLPPLLKPNTSMLIQCSFLKAMNYLKFLPSSHPALCVSLNSVFSLKPTFLTLLSPQKTHVWVTPRASWFLRVSLSCSFSPLELSATCMLDLYLCCSSLLHCFDFCIIFFSVSFSICLYIICSFKEYSTGFLYFIRNIKNPLIFLFDRVKSVIENNL